MTGRGSQVKSRAEQIIDPSSLKTQAGALTPKELFLCLE